MDAGAPLYLRRHGFRRNQLISSVAGETKLVALQWSSGGSQESPEGSDLILRAEAVAPAT